MTCLGYAVFPAVCCHEFTQRSLDRHHFDGHLVQSPYERRSAEIAPFPCSTEFPLTGNRIQAPVPKPTEIASKIPRWRTECDILVISEPES